MLHDSPTAAAAVTGGDITAPRGESRESSHGGHIMQGRGDGVAMASDASSLALQGVADVTSGDRVELLADSDRGTDAREGMLG